MTKAKSITDRQTDRQLELKLLMCTLKIDFSGYTNLLRDTRPHTCETHTHTLNL